MVSDYTADTFLAAFRRFISLEVYSDCDTNFVEADSQLHELFRLVERRTRSSVGWQTTASTGDSIRQLPPIS